MKRDVIVSQLIKEGFSEKTLVRFSDKQLSDLHERIVIDADKLKTDQKLKDLANDPNTEVEVEEELKGKQKNIDKNHNGEIDAEDFAILNKEKKSEVKEGDYHDERSKKALDKSKEDFPQLKNVKKCEECEKVESKCKCKKENIKEVKNWVKDLVENKEFHSFTSKNEIMELIQTKLNESDTMVQHGPKVKKGHNGVPEFMTYDAITDAEPKTAPSKPAPQTKPGTRPTPTRREDPRKTPFKQPGPGTNPKPKAKIAEEKKK